MPHFHGVPHKKGGECRVLLQTVFNARSHCIGGEGKPGPGSASRDRGRGFRDRSITDVSFWHL